ncbi:Hypothetical predicted protein [Mytilus galloprovincialis]|uniref:Endonuclease/exonuclease/phosphatase domain-containing protein n=1 Tax=Mytilus galloprovincialis TaxID=29158 RepID=A0A8B6FNU5_MYTGA|nr:Hypothetical predicted protein [Mytilus galloprovincialis]
MQLTKIMFGCIYVPPENSRYSSKDAFDEIETELITLKDQSTATALLGDFNARSGSLCDYIIPDDELSKILNYDGIDEIDRCLYDYHNLCLYNVPLQRSSEDKGRINIAIQSFIDVTNDLLDKNNSPNVPSKHIRWIGDKRDQFVDSVESKLTIDNLSNQLDTLDITNENFQTDLNELVESLNKVFLDSAIENFGNKPAKISRNSKHHQPWFNAQCRVKRDDFHQAKKKHNLFKNGGK